MSYALKDARITHISLVDKGANKRPFRHHYGRGQGAFANGHPYRQNGQGKTDRLRRSV